MPKYRAFTFFLVVAFVLSGCTPNKNEISPTPVPAQATVSPTPVGQYDDPELSRAVALGFGTWQQDNHQVKFSEFFTMLDHTVELADASKLEAWKQRFPKAQISSLSMDRFNGMLAVFYAAETLGEPYYSPNTDWTQLNNKIGEPWDNTHPNTSLFPNVTDIAPWGGNNFQYDADAYFYSFGRLSLFSDNPIFDYDAEKNSMRPDEPFLYTEALLAALRLYDSVQSEITARGSSEADSIILNAADQRRDAILNSPTTVQITGTSYYVSNHGDDNNDGLTPETAWATLDKVNSAFTQDWSNGDGRWNNDHFPEFLWASSHRDQRITLKPGDGVFFERGGVWRGMLRTVSGVTYSAYGEGKKPEIYGSPENGSGAEKWSLVEGTNNIWVFYKDLQDCGGILLDGNIVAIKQPALLYKDKYYDVGDEQYPQINDMSQLQVFDVKNLADLRFFNDIQYSDHNADNVPDYGTWGKLYLRSDAGNPGAVYSSIEFFTGNSDWGQGIAHAEDNSVIDNISFKYGAMGVDAQGSTNVTIQNCEVGWIGGIILDYDAQGLGSDTSLAVVRSGDGIAIGGKNNRAINNYVYQTFDNALTVEGYLMGNENANDHEAGLRENCVIEGNLIEKSSGGALIAGWYAYSNNLDMPLFQNMTIDKNIFLDVGQGGWAHLEDKGYSYLADVIVDLNPGSGNVTVANNILYATRPENSLVNLGYGAELENPVHFTGNIYTQNDFGYLIYRETRGENGTNNTYLCNLYSDRSITDVLGDTTAIVLPLVSSQNDPRFDIQKLTEAVNAIIASK